MALPSFSSCFQIPMTIAQAPDLSRVRLVAWDLETFKISKQEPFPYPICASFAEWDYQKGVPNASLYHVHYDQQAMLDRFRKELSDPNVLLVSQNGAAFDTTVICRAFPELQPLFYDKADLLHTFDTMVAQKIINIALCGNPEDTDAGLDALVLQYLGEDISKFKGADAVRVRYHEVWNIPVSEWPEEFRSYSIYDSVYTLQVAIEMLRRSEFPQILRAVCHRSRAMMYQSRKTLRGCAVDIPRISNLYQEALNGYDFSLYPELLSQNILRPATPPEPYARGTKAHTEDCDNPKSCDCPPKMKLGKPSGTSPSVLQGILAEWSRVYSIPVNLTKTARERAKDLGVQPMDGISEVRSWDFSLPGPFEPKDIARGREDCEQFAALLKKQAGIEHPVLGQWVEFNRYDKLCNTYIPRFIWDVGNDCQGSNSMKWEQGKKVALSMGKFSGPPDGWSVEQIKYEWVDTIRFASNPIVATGRFSGRGTNLYPSLNGQNLPRDLGIRECLIPRPGHVFAAVDYNAIELRAAAWRVKNIYGHSNLYDLIVEGHDPHAFLAAQLYYHLCREQIEVTEPGDGYESCVRRMRQFQTLKKTRTEVYSHWRTFAKPVGLGILGGMGPARIQEVAWKQYKIAITIQEATLGRDIWRDLMPYENLYLKEHVVDNLKSFRFEDRYCYVSPLGMVRENASWSAAANGDVLQTPTAEGMAEAICRVVRACTDWTQRSILYGSYKVDDVHDELLVETLWDETLEEKVKCIERLMQEAMGDVLTNTPIATEAAAMLRYSKGAKTVRDEQGRLIPYDQETKS